MNPSMSTKLKLSACFILVVFASYAQNSGIGTDTPGSKLEIIADNCDDTKSALNVKDNCSNSLLFMYNGGKVGIGTNTPAYKLSLVGTSSIANQTIAINNTPVAYLLNQSSNVGSIAFGNGLRSAQSSGGVAVRNTATGIGTLNALTSGNNNTATGYNALSLNTTGYSNNAFGYNALYSNTSGFSNTAVGESSLYTNSTGYANSAFGVYAMSSSNANNNSAFGYAALQNNTNGENNSAFGVNAIRAVQSGSNNTVIGFGAMGACTAGSDNTVMGFSALAEGTGSNNTVIGLGAMQRNTTGSGNIAIGYTAANKNSTGASNISIGSRANFNSTSGYNNISIGSNAGENMTTGGYNIIIGNYDGSASKGISTGGNNILIGTNVSYGTSLTASNQLNIGNLIFSKAIGANDVLPFWGRIGIKNSDPKSTFEVGGSVGYKVVSKTTNYNADEEAIILVDASSAVTINLPAAADVNGRTYTIKKIAGSNNVTIYPGADNIDGANQNYIISTTNDFVTLVCDGDNWFVIGK